MKSSQFKENADRALHNKTLQKALSRLKEGFIEKRAHALAELPEFNLIRDHAVEFKNHTLNTLDFYLEQFEARVLEVGGVVHWAYDAKEACQMAIEIANSVNAKLITKGKSMVSEEIGLTDALSEAGFTVVETDLGEYIIQLRHERPSHIVVPAIHVLKEEIAKNFYAHHQDRDPKRLLSDISQLVAEARDELRQKFITADVGITGANFLIAENGASVIVTNEGNGDLTQTCAKVHIVVASIDKVVPTFEAAAELIRLLSRSATGQEMTSYVTFSMGPKRPSDLDGPTQFHVILVDNGRSNMLGTHFQPMLRCIRCGACLNHCPIYDAIGGQAYGSVYTGPMGAVLTPALFGLAHSKDLPNASTFCGRCEEVCPMRIPLPGMMRYYREEEYEKQLSAFHSRTGLKCWAFFAKRPRLYHILMAFVASMLGRLGRRKGRFRSLPLAHGWTKYRDFPAPATKTFHQLWRSQKRSGMYK